MSNYIGYEPKPGTYIKFDDISSSFDGLTTEFDVTQDAVPVVIPSLRQCIVSLNGVIQEPGVSIQAGSSSTKLQFATAPQSGDVFWGMVFGTAYSISTVTDGAITTVKLDDGAVSSLKIQNGAVVEAAIGTGAVTEDKIGAGAVTNTKIEDNAVTLQKIQDSAVIFSKIASSAIASQAEAEAGTAADKLMTAERTAEAIASLGAGNLIDIKYYTATGATTWTKPANCTKVRVIVIGGGGEGENSGGSTGNAGGDSSFGAHCSATGGEGGQSGGRTPGSGTGGDLNFTGEVGGPYPGSYGGAAPLGYCPRLYGDNGTANTLGYGGGGEPFYSTISGVVGGAAGGAAVKWITSGLGATETVTVGIGGQGHNGGDGAPGLVIVEEYT